MPADTAGPSALILHQYEVSPFSEKVRAVLGMKQCAWHACNQPVILPKPELIALTAGYRRIPVLQIGADLWFDSLYIIEELERRFPSPSVFAGSGVGLVRALSRWTDGDVFMAVVGALFGGDWVSDEAFVRDRSELMGAPFDPKQMAAAAPALTLELKRHLDILETQLADGRVFLTGAAPDAVDAAVWCDVAFMRWGQGALARLLEAYPRLHAWAERMAQLGHGRRGADVSREEAVAVAKAASPVPLQQTAQAAAASGVDITPGARVNVKYLDANTPVLTGELARIDLRGFSLRVQLPTVGSVHIHMPHSVATVSAG